MGEILSMMGLYNYDPTIFDDLVIPDVLDSQVLIDNILMESVELEVLYPDPAAMKFAIGAWSSKRLDAWQKMADVLYVDDYNPFENVYRKENRKIVQDRNITYKNTGNTTNAVAAYNESTFTNRERISPDLTNTDTGQVVNTEEFEVHGDSAISDTQDLIKKEMEIRKNYDLYNYIIDEFISRFCLLVY